MQRYRLPSSSQCSLTLQRVTTNEVSVSIIVPVYNNPHDLVECLTALIPLSSPEVEIIVVDDASTDDTHTVMTQSSVRVLRLLHNSGPAAARNHGARHAQGKILFFVDADIIISPSAVSHVVQLFNAYPDIAAIFGSYDAHPRAPGVVSQYRNLLHHFVHQHGNPAATTFWAGCGAIRRVAFEAVGGFDAQRFPSPSIEDIELGHRLRLAGYHILLEKTLQGTHLKRWTLRSMIWTDICCRAVPWSRLSLEGQGFPNDLNLSKTQRLSTALVGLASVCLVLAVCWPPLLVTAAIAFCGVFVINRTLYAFFCQQGGLLFAAVCLPLHWLYYLYSGLSYLYVWLRFRETAGEFLKPVEGPYRRERL